MKKIAKGILGFLTPFVGTALYLALTYLGGTFLY